MCQFQMYMHLYNIENVDSCLNNRIWVCMNYTTHTGLTVLPRFEAALAYILPTSAFIPQSLVNSSIAQDFWVRQQLGIKPNCFSSDAKFIQTTARPSVSLGMKSSTCCFIVCIDHKLHWPQSLTVCSRVTNDRIQASLFKKSEWREAVETHAEL